MLELYDPLADTVLSADASSYGLGAMLLDGQHHNQMEASSLASRSISDTEHRGACSYLGFREIFNLSPGKHFAVETDHKLLVPLLSSKLLGDLPPRNPSTPAQDDQVHFSISHVPGTQLHTADALSLSSFQSSGGGGDGVRRGGGGIHRWSSSRTTSNQSTGKRSDMCEGPRDL